MKKIIISLLPFLLAVTAHASTVEQKDISLMSEKMKNCAEGMPEETTSYWQQLSDDGVVEAEKVELIAPTIRRTFSISGGHEESEAESVFKAVLVHNEVNRSGQDNCVVTDGTRWNDENSRWGYATITESNYDAQGRLVYEEFDSRSDYDFGYMNTERFTTWAYDDQDRVIRKVEGDWRMPDTITCNYYDEDDVMTTLVDVTFDPVDCEELRIQRAAEEETDCGEHGEITCEESGNQVCAAGCFVDENWPNGEGNNCWCPADHSSRTTSDDDGTGVTEDCGTHGQIACSEDGNRQCADTCMVDENWPNGESFNCWCPADHVSRSE